MIPRILLLTAIAAMTVSGVPTVSAQTTRPPAKAEPAKAPPAKAAPSKAAPKPDAKPRGDARYGNWDKSWGVQPPAPPKHFTKHGDWYRHVRACQRAYRSYDARTDSYRSHAGRTIRCQL